MKAHPVKLVELLKAPEFFDGRVLCFEITESQMEIVRRFCRVHADRIFNMHLTLKPYDNTWSEQAQHFLFMVRDRICGIHEDYSKENKEQIYAAAMIEAGFINDDGERKSLHDLDAREMWILIETMLRLAVEAGCDISDLEELGNEVNQGIKE
jgi:hypothetical protein